MYLVKIETVAKMKVFIALINFINKDKLIEKILKTNIIY